MMKINELPAKCHNLKLREDFCDDVCMGLKNFEVRENDRGFQKGDKVKFQCVDKSGLSLPHVINSKKYEITYVLNGWGIKDGYVVFGIREILNGEERENEETTIIRIRLW